MGFKKVLRALRIAFLLPVMAGLAKGGKGGGSYSPPAAAPAVAQNVSVDRDPDSDVAKLASNAKKRGWWWTQTQERKSSGASGKTLGTGL